jgi:hypothetical protein
MASPAELIDARIEELDDWRGVPAWYHGGTICTGEKGLVRAAADLNLGAAG